MQQARSITALTALVAAMVMAPGAASDTTPSSVVAEPSFARLTTGRLDAAGVRRLEAARWMSYRTAAAGPTVRVSPAYPDAGAIWQRWSSFFQSLLHGPELASIDREHHVAAAAPATDVHGRVRGSDPIGPVPVVELERRVVDR